MLADCLDEAESTGERVRPLKEGSTQGSYRIPHPEASMDVYAPV